MKETIQPILIDFFKQVKTNILTTKNFVPVFRGLEMKVGFGFGNPARIPWIAFLGKDQTPQNGIFPVYYFFKEQHTLILANALSETEIPKLKWLVSPRTETVSAYFKKSGIEPYKYGSSYVYEVYDTKRIWIGIRWKGTWRI